MNESRTKRYRPGRLPRQKRTLSIFGAASYVDGRVVKDQSDKIYRCWNCGFICNEQHQNIKRGDGVGYIIKDIIEADALDIGASAIEYPGESGSNAVTMRLQDPCIRMMKLDSEGNAVTVMHNQSQIVTSGCPLCGTMNYR